MRYRTLLALLAAFAALGALILPPHLSVAQPKRKHPVYVGAKVCGSGSVGWFSLSRKRQIAEVVDGLSRLF